MNLVADVGVDINSFAPAASQQTWPMLAQVIGSGLGKRPERLNETCGVKSSNTQKRGRVAGIETLTQGFASAPASDFSDRFTLQQTIVPGDERPGEIGRRG
jgi:hypothetical protein